MADQDPFLEHRRLLFATAYRMLGTVTDAEHAIGRREQQATVFEERILVGHGVNLLHAAARVALPPLDNCTFMVIFLLALKVGTGLLLTISL